MNIEEVVKYHKQAEAFLEERLKEIALAPGDDNAVALGLALDFHRRAIIVLMAAKEMFENHPGLVEKAAAYDALQK